MGAPAHSRALPFQARVDVSVSEPWGRMLPLRIVSGVLLVIAHRIKYLVKVFINELHHSQARRSVVREL